MKRLGALILCAIVSILLTGVTAAAQVLPVPLGTAEPFGALAGSGITNSGSTTITGDVGSHPTLAQTGFAGANSVTIIGTNHFGDAVTQGAKIDLRNGFLNAFGRGPTAPLLAGGALGGLILTPGVYKHDGALASLGLIGTLTLDFQGDPNAVFIFQSDSTLITEVGSSVVMINNNGGEGCNVFWQVGSAATLKTNTTFIGTVMASDDISLQAGATVAGRLLAGAQANGAGALTLIGNTITVAACAALPVADLTIGKSHLGAFAQGQVGAVYTLVARNVGLGPTAGVVTVTDALPAGLTATAISGLGWTCTLAPLACTRPDVLAAGASYAPITVTVNVAANAPAIVTNATAISGGGELNFGNNNATDTTVITPVVPPASDLTITKSHAGNFQQTGTGNYTLIVRNAGLAPTNGAVSVSDILPAGLTATGISGPGWTCTPAPLACTRSDVLGAGASYAPITVTVGVAADAPAVVINTTTVSGGGELNPANNTATDVTVINPAPSPPPPPPPPPPPMSPDLTIAKNHSGDFQIGGSGAYTLTVTNRGPGPSIGAVTVSDTLPEGLTATGISGPGWTCTLASLSCTRNDALAAGADYPPITVTVSVAGNPLIFNQTSQRLTFQPGDILLSMHDGTVQWRRSDWTLVKIIESVSDGQAKGMAFDTLGNLFLTHYFGTGHSGNSVVKFGPDGSVIGLFGGAYDCNPSSITLDATGNAYIGQADCSGDIFKFDSHGNRLTQYDVAVENRGSGHIALDPDQCTMYSTSQGRNVKRFNVCTNTQMPDFNRAPLPEAIDGAHQFTLLPDGGMLIANFGSIVRLDVFGDFVRTYDAPGENHCWLGMALYPDGTSFWATDWCGSSATRFGLAAGEVIESHAAVGSGHSVKQIIVVPPDLTSVVVNTTAVSGGNDADTSNNSASDSTTIINQPLTPALSIGAAFLSNAPFPCIGAGWNLRVSQALPNASVRLLGTTNGQPWMVADWAVTDANGMVASGGTFLEGTQGSYTLRVVVGGRISNTVSFVVSNCP